MDENTLSVGSLDNVQAEPAPESPVETPSEEESAETTPGEPATAEENVPPAEAEPAE